MVTWRCLLDIIKISITSYHVVLAYVKHSCWAQHCPPQALIMVSLSTAWRAFPICMEIDCTLYCPTLWKAERTTGPYYMKWHRQIQWYGLFTQLTTKYGFATLNQRKMYERTQEKMTNIKGDLDRYCKTACCYREMTNYSPEVVITNQISELAGDGQSKQRVSSRALIICIMQQHWWSSLKAAYEGQSLQPVPSGSALVTSHLISFFNPTSETAKWFGCIFNSFFNTQE